MTVNPHITVLIDDDDLHHQLLADVRAGLHATPKRMPPKWFYDKRGSALFEQITQLPGYYLTRSEASILTDFGPDIVSATHSTSIVELGSGMSEKTRILLDAFAKYGGLESYYPFDVSDVTVEDSIELLSSSYPQLAVGGVVGDFSRHLRHMPSGDNRMVVLLGSTIGNMLHRERRELLSNLRHEMHPGEKFLVGADRVKKVDTMVAAYDDPEGVTAKFNRNLLYVLNRHFDGDFQPDQFKHIAVWDEKSHVVEMRLRAQRPMTVDLSALDMEVHFETGEELRTSVSTKFHLSGLREELEDAGFHPLQYWTDLDKHFALQLAEAV